MTELRWLYDRRDLEEAWGDLAAWLNKWQGKYPKLCKWKTTSKRPWLSTASPRAQASEESWRNATTQLAEGG